MRDLILQMQTSVDGFVAGPEGELDWMFKSLDAETAVWIVEHLSRAGVHIMGRRTYHDMAAHWPGSTEPFAPPMNDIPKVVFSKKGSLEPAGSASTTQALEDARKATAGSTNPRAAELAVAWAASRVAGGELAGEIARLKQEPGGEILAHGGASFARSLVEAGVVDEFRLLVHPVALGRGLPLFSALRAPLDLRLVTTRAFPAGTVAQVYRRA